MYNQGKPSADELAIANILKVLSTPQICQHFTEEEQKIMLAAIKSHIISNAIIINKIDFGGRIR